MILSYLKRGSYNSLFFGLSSAIVRAINFLFLPYLLSKLSLEEFGIWDFYQMLFSYGTLLLSSCAATGMTRFFLFYKDDSLKQKQAIGNSFFAVFCGALFLCMSAFFFSWTRIGIFTNEYVFIIAASISLFTLFSLVPAILPPQLRMII